MDTIDTVELFAKYPHLAQKITTLWGTAECRELLMSLISDSRDGARAGFSPQNAKSIFALLQRHDVVYPHFDKSSDIVTFGFPSASRPLNRPVKNESGDWKIVKYIGMFFVLVLIVGLLKIIF